MKLFAILIFSSTIFFLSCTNNKRSDKSEIADKVKVDSASSENKPDETLNTISLEPVISGIPHFNNKEADAFVSRTKTYFEQMVEATKTNDQDKILELQLQAMDIDEEMRKVKSKLSTEQQKQLADWYMRLVQVASK